jgi:hypothetical protein
MLSQHPERGLSGIGKGYIIRMQSAWSASVKKSGILRVYNGAPGKWVSVFKKSVDAFNELSEANGLGVKFQAAGSATDAEVTIKVGKAPFPGAVHGITQLGVDSITGNTVIAEITLPSDTTDMNTQIMEVVMVHEFIHACGLDNKEHGNDGVFYSPLSKSGGRMIVPEPKKQDVPMPPLRMDPGTVSKIQSLWS